MVKNQPGETRVQVLVWEVPLEERILSLFNHVTQNQENKSVIIIFLMQNSVTTEALIFLT